MPPRAISLLRATRTLLAAAAAPAVVGLSTVAAQQPGATAARELALVDSVFTAFADATAPGCALAVVRDGRFAFSRGYGSANLDYGIPIDGRSVFYLASVSKQFTAAAIALAAADGRLSLDDDVRVHMPELPDYGTPITVRQLVHHTSGLRDYLTLISLSGRRADDHWTDAALLELIARQRATNFPPGSEYLYSNTGYVLLAAIAGRATGSTLRRYVDERIFRPLGMRDSHFHDDAGQVVPRRVIGYARGAGGAFRMNHWFAFDKVGDGGMYSSVEDLARWEQNFYSGAVGGPRFLEQIHQRGMLTGGDTIPYAFGLTHGTHRGLSTVSHGGSLAGFRTAVLRFPEQRFSSIVLCNSPAANAAQLAHQVAAVFLGSQMSAPAAPPMAAAANTPTTQAAGAPAAQPAGLSASDLARYTGRFHSDELDALYTLEPGAGVLVLRRGADTRVELRPSASGEFSGGFLLLRFDDEAAAFVIDAGRVRGIRFQRMD
jgi:CubicO group peptidase (beta-lactamase class C family)